MKNTTYLQGRGSIKYVKYVAIGRLALMKLTKGLVVPLPRYSSVPLVDISDCLCLQGSKRNFAKAGTLNDTE